MMREQKGIFIPESDKSKFWGKNYEIREYNKIKPRGYRAIDIGAHVGIWTRRLAVDFSEVIAFEPMPKHIECHKKNCEGLDNVVLNEIALSNVNEQKVMTTKDNNSGMSTLMAPKWRLPKTIVPIETRTLDSCHFPRIDFIKIDVEGWEEQVLRGGMDTILKYRPRMYIEIWTKEGDQMRPANYDKISNMLWAMQYTLQRIGNDNYICDPGGQRLL
jgi:FkbM family methyltransferase